MVIRKTLYRELLLGLKRDHPIRPAPGLVFLQPALPEIPLELIGADPIGVANVEPSHGPEKSGKRRGQIDRNPALGEHLGAADRCEVSPDPDLQGQHSVDGVLDVLGEHRCPVVKQRLLTQVEDITPRVVGNLVGRRQIQPQLGGTGHILNERAVEVDGGVVDPTVEGCDRIECRRDALSQQHQMRAFGSRRAAQRGGDQRTGK